MDYSRTDFLNGEYPLGFALSPSLMNQMMDAFRGTPEYLRYATGSIGRDYDGEERYQAAYLMAEFDIGGFLTVLPGVRWEKDYSLYHGQRYREVSLNNIQGDPADLAYLTNERRNEFWLPMLHLIATPADWLKIRLARTETLTRPDYIQYAPITYINSYQSYGRAANADLKPALSVNYDVAVSVYESFVGLFSVSGFYKEITDLIFQTRYDLQRGIPPLPGMNVPESWYQQATPQFDTYINNPFEATYKGFELEWQTHFWYLPSIFHGIVLNVNYTRIYSDTEKRLYYLARGDRIPGPGPPRYATIIKDSSRTARMPDQPAHIVNVTLGYDWEGFSVRLSYLYQTDKVTFIDREPILDNFTGEYSRWDITLQQKLDWGLVLFANLTNLTATPDEQFRGYTLTSPTYTEYYGFAMDVGIRFNL
jgi:TonB-dependent receptor